MKPMSLIAAILLIVGGLNWGLVGIANFDLVATIFGDGSVVSKAVYIVVGVAAVLMLVSLLSNRKANA
jgi:uncharacterized membrane protein YuzA (DUF378 family)